jgi:hypothetical protein
VTLVDAIESGLWTLAAWQSVRVARHLRGGVLSREFWWIGIGFALGASVRWLGEVFSAFENRPTWPGAGAAGTIWLVLDCAAWVFVGVGAFRLRRAFESI